MSSQRSIPTVDRISNLPDFLIFHILSFLPTKQSAATSVLSKRWKPLWLSLLTLDFDDQNFADFATFRHFAYSVMLSRNITLPLRSFSLKCGNSSCVNPHDVNRFINAVVQRGIQNLNLDMSPMRVYFELPTSVFSCINLSVLKLNNLQINYSSQVNFPLLKTLHLYSIYFLKARDDFLILRLLNGCPLLEDLKTENLLVRDSVYGVKEFDGLLKLVRANISNLHFNIPLDWVRNAKFLRSTLKSPYFHQVPTFPNLTHMEIVFQFRNTNWFGKWKWKWLTKVLQNCPNLQNLTIHEDTSYVNEIGDDDWMDPPIVPGCVSSHLKTCSLIAFKGMKCELEFAEYILKNAKALHTMKISASPVDSNIKLQMLMKLSLCPRGSTTCKLSFD